MYYGKTYITDWSCFGNMEKEAIGWGVIGMFDHILTFPITDIL